MDLDREVKKLGQVVKLQESFKSQQNGDINLSRNILRRGGELFEMVSVGFKNGYIIYY